MKTLSFEVKITFSDQIENDGDIQVIANNIANGIREQADSWGIVPEDAEYYTKDITVSYDGYELIKNRL